MESFFFGNEQPKFAVFHPSQVSSDRGAVLVAPPPLGESLRAHHVLRTVATSLSEVGFETLRFDYRGCGNSFGELPDMTLDHWIDDLREATTELKEMSGQSQVSIFTCRFGAAIAAAVSAASPWRLAVIWDPVFSGQHWLDQLVHLRSQWRSHEAASAHEYMGETTSPAFTESLRQFSAPQLSAKRTVILSSVEPAEPDQDWEHRNVAFDANWLNPSIENVMAHAVVTEAVAVISK